MEGGHWVVCPRGGGSPRIAIDENRAHITVLACVTMTGATIEPMFIVKGKSERVYPDILSKLTKQHVIATGHIHISPLPCHVLISVYLFVLNRQCVDHSIFICPMDGTYIHSLHATHSSRSSVVIGGQSFHPFQF